MASGFFHEIESPTYHLQVYDPQCRSYREAGFPSEQAVMNFKSKISGTVLAYIDLDRVTDMPHDRWATFFERADALDGAALDDHLSCVITLGEMDTSQFPFLKHGLYQELDERPDQSNRTLAGMANTHFLGADALPAYLPWQRLGEEVEKLPFPDTPEGAQSRETILKHIQGYERLERANPASLQNSSFDDVLNEIRRELTRFGLHRNAMTTQRFRDQWTYLSQCPRNPNIDRFLTALTTPDLNGELTPGHPLYEGVYRLVFADNPLISREDVDASRLLTGTHASCDLSGRATSRLAVHDDQARFLASSPAVTLNFISMGKTYEAQRNALQFFRPYRFHSSVLNSRSFSHRSGRDYAEAIYAGENPSRLLYTMIREFLEQGQQDYHRLQRDKFGKRDFQALISNIHEVEKILLNGLPGNIATLEGEQLRVHPLSRTEIHELSQSQALDEHMRHYQRLARVEMFDARGQRLFESLFNVDNLGRASAIALTDLPKHTLTQPQHLFALNALGTNVVLTKKLVSGFLLLRDGALKKAEAYRGAWESMTHRIDRYLDGSEPYGVAADILHQHKALESYVRPNHLRDAEHILSRLRSALVVHYLVKAGVEVESPYDDIETLSSELNDHDRETVKVHGELFAVDEDGINLEGALQPQFANYVKLLALSDELHKGFAPLKKDAGPRSELHWESCLPPITLDLPSGKQLTMAHLTSYLAVLREGEHMAHCVGSYAAQCMQGEYAVFSIQQDGVPVATLGMYANGDSLRFDQIQGPGNSALDREIEEAVMPVVRTLEADNAYAGHEVVIEPADSREVSLTDAQLQSLQLDFDIENDAGMAACRTFLVDKLGVNAVHEALRDGISRALLHFQTTIPEPEWDDAIEEFDYAGHHALYEWEFKAFDDALAQMETDLGVRHTASMAMG